METTEFDATLGGSEHLPYSANSLKFAASRSVEIAAMTECIYRPSKTKLIFQTLPVHMRRRVMSHNSNRLPRRLREGHLEQLKKSGLPPKQKRPSRKYRRRPANLLDEYNRRQKRNVWLETHIWHAKRFHMIERWGHRLANAPCDKAFRACYRASSAHCLLQDISYYTSVKITGTLENIKTVFGKITNPSCGLQITAKAFTTGNREGTIHLYKENSYPFGYVGKIQFIWLPRDNTDMRILWLFIHPSQVKQIMELLNNIVSVNFKYEEGNESGKRRKLDNKMNVTVTLCSGTFNRFRLTGPNSHAVLTKSLKCVNKIETIKSNNWISSSTEKALFLKEKDEYWQLLQSVSSPAQLSPRIVVGLIVRDPRLCRPSHRTKAVPNSSDNLDIQTLIKLPPSLPNSPLWDTKIHESIKKNRLTNGQFIEHITKTQLVPGEVNFEDPALQSVPVVLIQRPGSQDSQSKKLGYGSGWDIIVPSGYGIPFWLTFVMFGARTGGLRETESLSFEMAECYFPPDSEAGHSEEIRVKEEMREKYFILPPSKRVNYVKLSANSPFICPWKVLLKDWNNSCEDFFVLRDKKLLERIQECIVKKQIPPNVENSDACLVPVYIQLEGKGNLKWHALICLPQLGDKSKKSIMESQMLDPNEKLRKEKRAEHKKNMKRWRRKRIKLKKNRSLNGLPTRKSMKNVPSAYVLAMRELWLPSNVTTVRKSSSREIIGYLSQGAFSFSEAKSCGVGYVGFNALKSLLQSGQNQVLVRNTSSKIYRFANLKIVMST